MALITLIKHFINGLKSTVSLTGTLQHVLSSAISDGVQGGINRVLPVLMKSIILGAVFLTGVFLFGYGIAKWADSMFATPGLGFVITGTVLIVAGSVYLHGRKED